MSKIINEEKIKEIKEIKGMKERLKDIFYPFGCEKIEIISFENNILTTNCGCAIEKFEWKENEIGIMDLEYISGKSIN